MEYVNSSWYSGEPAALTVCSHKNDQDVTHTSANENTFQCTFFRPTKSKYVTKDYASKPPDDNSILYNLSDTCTDTESEYEELVNPETYLGTYSKNTKSLHTLDKNSFQHAEKTLNTPRVTFSPTLRSHSERPVKSCLKKGSMKKETSNNFDRVESLPNKRNYLKERHDLKNRKQDLKVPTRFPIKFDYQTITKGKVSSEQRIRNTSIQNILRNAKRTIESASALNERGLNCKKKKPTDVRVLRNKCLLKSMKRVIKAIYRQEGSFDVSLESDESVQPRNKSGAVDLVKQRKSNEQKQQPELEGLKKIRLYRVVKSPEIPKPVFKRPEVEKLLNDSMHAAVKRYRMCSDTWERRAKIARIC